MGQALEAPQCTRLRNRASRFRPTGVSYSSTGGTLGPVGGPERALDDPDREPRMIPFAMDAASTPAQMPTLATRLPSGRDPGAVPLPGSLAVRGAGCVGLERGSHLRLHRQLERWQAIGRGKSGALVGAIAGPLRCGTIRQDGSALRARRTGHGRGCLGQAQVRGSGSPAPRLACVSQLGHDLRRLTLTAWSSGVHSNPAAGARLKIVSIKGCFGLSACECMPGSTAATGHSREARVTG